MNWKRLSPQEKTVPRNLKKRNIALPIIVTLCQIGLTLVITKQYPKVIVTETPSSNNKSENFRLAVNNAMRAAKLTQVAHSGEEWKTITSWWQEAFDLVRTVPASSSHYQLAQARVDQYQRNLEYAQKKSLETSTITTASSNLWTVGSRWEDVQRIQGEPTRVNTYNYSCKDVAYYTNSRVEFKKGIVTDYKDVDSNLIVAVNEDAKTASQHSGNFWTLGSRREDILRIQGTPTQVVQYNSLGEEILYYERSTVELENGVVTEYDNFDENLSVSVKAGIQPSGENAGSFWTVGSSREDIFQIQGTPSRVVQHDSLCKEVIYYGGSSIELKNRVVNGYRNFDNNLKVK
ncbi:MAG: hypothetical protein WA919_30155 [Coleofasciculaceae cyanobacterium]